jgi:hypothetical protein
MERLLNLFFIKVVLFIDEKQIAFGLINAAPSKITAEAQISLQMFCAQEQPIMLDSSKPLLSMHFILLHETFVTVAVSSLVTDLHVTLNQQSADKTRYTLNSKNRKELSVYVFKRDDCESYNRKYVTGGIL